jgi:hypothetical protein
MWSPSMEREVEKYFQDTRQGVTVNRKQQLLSLINCSFDADSE